MQALRSPSDPAIPYLPPLQPEQERPPLAPGPRKSQQARDQRTRGDGRGLSARVQPIQWWKAACPETSRVANLEAGGAVAVTARVARSISRRQGAAEGCTAGGGERVGRRGARGFPEFPRAQIAGTGPALSSFARKVGTQVKGQATT